MDESTFIGPFTVSEIKSQFDGFIEKQKSLTSSPSSAFFFILQQEGRNSDYAVKHLPSEEVDDFECELAWAKRLEKCVPSTKPYTFPKGYGFLKHRDRALYVVEYLPGPVFWDLMDQGKRDLKASDASDIASAILELRHNPNLTAGLRENDLSPCTRWFPRSILFPYDDDGGRMLEDRDDFVSFMRTRFQKARVKEDLVPLDGAVWTFGILSPHNIKRLADGRIAFLTLKSVFLAPEWWQAYGVRHATIRVCWNHPLMEAFRNHGLVFDERIARELDEFRIWFAGWGGRSANMEDFRRADQGN